MTDIPITTAMLEAGAKHLRLARENGCGEEEDMALVAVIYTAMRLANPDGPEAAVLLKECVEALEGIERIAEKHTRVSGARSLQTAMHAIAHAARATLAAMTKGEE